MQPSALNTYLRYDANGGYAVAESGPLTRETTLQSNVTWIHDAYVSGAEWLLETSAVDPANYPLRYRRNNRRMDNPLLQGTRRGRA